MDHRLLIVTAHAVQICRLAYEEAQLEVIPVDRGLLILTVHAVLVCRLFQEVANLEVVQVDHRWACRQWERLGHHIPA